MPISETREQKKTLPQPQNPQRTGQRHFRHWQFVHGCQTGYPKSTGVVIFEANNFWFFLRH